MALSESRPGTTTEQIAGRLHYAWIVAPVTFLVLLVAAGVRTAPAVLMTPLMQKFGWSHASISFAVGISLIWFGLGGPVGGSLIDRFGPRRVMLGGLALIGLGLALMLGMSNLWQFHVAWGVVTGIGTGAVAQVLGATVAHRWFRTHRGLVIGLFGAASAAGQLIFLPAMIGLTRWGGWQAAVGVTAAVVLALMAPVLLLMRDQPEAISLRPLGDPSPGPGQSDGTQRALDVTESAQHTTLAQAARTRDFWLLAASFFICGYTTNGLIGTHLLPHAIEHGFSDVAAASALGLMGMMNIVGTLASGWLSDRYDNRFLLATYYGLRALAIAGLPFVIDMSGLLIFAILYGLDWVATVPPTVNLTAMRFGKSSLGTLYGWIFFSHMLGAGLAAYAGGVVRDSLGSYTPAFVSAALLGFLAAAFSLSITPLRRPRVVPALSAE
ncbi:MAG TPA: MFS transporter [Roseiflexaceae bacterium]|nr:MFS transporter [Roseiflexaceae bacterium]